jgi:hypothetical protein
LRGRQFGELQEVPADRGQRGRGHRGQQRGGPDGPDAALPGQS